MRQKETGNVECVDRLGQELDARCAEAVCRETKVCDECCAHVVRIDAFRRNPCQAVELHTAECLCVVDCPCDAVLKFADAVGVARDAAFTCGPIACRQVVQYLYEAVTRQTFGDVLLRVSIRKQILHTRETRCRRGFETVEKIDLVVEHRQIRSELWHEGDLID